MGNYSSSCCGAVDSNYTISYVTGLVTIGPAPLSITASSGSMTYGGSPPAITASYSGFVNGQGPSVLGGGGDLHHGGHRHQRGGLVRLVVQRRS